jgi:hypothetical protein
VIRLFFAFKLLLAQMAAASADGLIERISRNGKFDPLAAAGNLGRLMAPQLATDTLNMAATAAPRDPLFDHGCQSNIIA